MSLFREEVFEHRKEKLHGDVQLAVPVSWQLVAIVFFVIVAAGLLFLSLAGYSRIETVSGLIVPEQGLARIVPSRAGIVEDLAVEEGQVVEQGAWLAVIQTGEVLPAGGDSSTAILTSLGRQEEGLSTQAEQIAASASAERRQLDAQVSGLQSDIAGLRQQIAVQEGLVESAGNELELAEKVAERGFISRRDVLQREETYLTRQQQLTQMNQQLSARMSDIDQARAAMARATAAAGMQIAALSGQRSDIAQRRTNAEMSDAFRIIAPVSGTVTALTAREGQTASPQQPLMTIVPGGSSMQAELYVPTSAVGFLETGQQVRLALDAFPYQRFGTVPAQIVSIASAPVMQTGPDGTPLPVYLVVARPERASVDAYGQEESLIAGMTLTARIITEKQSLIEWLFEPLFAVRNR